MKLFDSRDRLRKQVIAQPVENLRSQPRCPEGHLISAQRQQKFQAIRCPECGKGVFILPTSWLPVPLAPMPRHVLTLSQVGINPNNSLSPSLTSDDDQDDLVDFDESTTTGHGALDESTDKPEPDPYDMSNDPAADYPVEPISDVNPAELARIAREDLKKKSRRKTKAKSNAEEADNEKAQTPNNPDSRPTKQNEVDQSGPDELQEDDLLSDSVVQSRKFRLNRKAMVFAGVLIIICLTVYNQIHQRHLEQLPHRAQLGQTEGLKKLKAGNFDEAKQILNDAAAAYQEMGDTSETARQIMQASQEAGILADLAGRPIEEILDRFAADEAGKAQFEALDQGRSLIIQSQIIKTPENGGYYDIDYRVAVGPGPDPARPLGRFNIGSLKVLDNLKPNVGDYVLIGLRIKGFKLSDGEWLIQVDPDSGVLMTDWDALATLGWPVTDRPEEKTDR